MGAVPDFGDLAALREEYELGGLGEDDLTAEPLELFSTWFAQVREAGLPEPNAMVVATAAADLPSARFVLLKGVVGGEFCFYTNLASRKGEELAGNPHCALLFPWHPLQRQVRVEGPVRSISRERVEEYFESRPRGSQLGAWASAQSQEVASREALEAAYDDIERRFADEPVPCPPIWGGFAVRPEVVEFWQGRSGRMHDRLVYRRTEHGDAWRTTRLAP